MGITTSEEGPRPRAQTETKIPRDEPFVLDLCRQLFVECRANTDLRTTIPSEYLSKLPGWSLQDVKALEERLLALHPSAKKVSNETLFDTLKPMSLQFVVDVGYEWHLYWIKHLERTLSRFGRTSVEGAKGFLYFDLASLVDSFMEIVTLIGTIDFPRGRSSATSVEQPKDATLTAFGDRLVRTVVSGFKFSSPHDVFSFLQPSLSLLRYVLTKCPTILFEAQVQRIADSELQTVTRTMGMYWNSQLAVLAMLQMQGQQRDGDPPLSPFIMWQLYRCSPMALFLVKAELVAWERAVERRLDESLTRIATS